MSASLKKPLPAFPAAAVFLLTLLLAGLFYSPVRADENEGQALNAEEALIAVAKAASSEDWGRVVEVLPPLIGQSPALEENFIPVLAYALFMSGKNDDALKLLEGRTGQMSLLMKDAIDGKKGVAPFFIEAGGAGTGLGMFPKAAEKTVVRKAFYSIAADADVQRLAAFEGTVAPKASQYIIAGAVLAEDSSTAYCLAFVDTLRLSEDLGLVKKSKEVRFGLLTRKGGDMRRKNLLNELSGSGLLMEDLGRGDFYSLGDKARVAGAVAELSEDARVLGGALKSNFKNIEGEVTITIFNSESGETITELKERTSIVHLDEEKGKDLAIEKGYQAVSKKIKITLADLERKIEWVPAGMPPFTVTVSTEKVFSNNYKFYAKNPVAEITIKNNSEKPISNVRASFHIKDYMDFPSQADLGDVPGRSTVKKGITTVFNSKLLDITEDTFLQSELKVNATAKGKDESVTVNQPVYVYERHALVWDDKGKVAAFVTSKDPLITDFATQAIGGYRNIRLNKNLVTAKALFEALAVLKVRYQEDVNNPYQVISGLSTVVDSVQFPRETLARKAGDCDDLTTLYSSLLESVGVKTKLIDAPGHLYMMFDTGVGQSEAYSFGFPEESYTVSDGTIWVPVETTLVGSSFTVAWRKGAEEFNEEKDKVKLIDLRDAWQINTPPSFAPAVSQTHVTKNEIEKMFPGELEDLERQRTERLAVNMEKLGPMGLKELMVIYAKDGLLDKAREAGERLLKAGRDSMTVNNMGNILFLKGDMEGSAKYYEEAARLSPGDAGIWINLARSYIRKGHKDKARDALSRALALDAGLKDKYFDVYSEVER